MSAPREQEGPKTNFQLSLSLSEAGDPLEGPPPPPPPLPAPFPRRPEVRPLPATSMLKYETKLFEIEVEDKGLKWKRTNRTKVAPGDKSFNFMCQPYLDSRLISLITLAGCTEDNKVLKLVERGQGVKQEHGYLFYHT